ncbi:MarR family winged helix-turn-helix transcriptional regulator [Deinococcus roseus]|uniref:HTH marR-type domain-containing protein n=1 Tax=Deinococcus roseus TaxID=392414 RepID=A0ABQ2CZB4_9DEIO|nr:MarR family transcriptional regulator [Deinococcus roseus]GGJ29138.1 hypothetical protein GCM10008938_14110 [Deinococcus roseus]
MSKPVFYLKRAYLFMRKSFDERLKQHDLTTSQFEVMGHLYPSHLMDQQELQQRNGITSATLTGILDKLEERGLLSRIPSNLDGRSKQVQLTHEGQTLFSQLIHLVHDFEDVMLKGFSAAERALLADWLQRITVNLGDSGPA